MWKNVLVPLALKNRWYRNMEKRAGTPIYTTTNQSIFVKTRGID